MKTLISCIFLLISIYSIGQKPSSKKQFSEFSEQYIAEELGKWQAKGEFEKTADWQVRVTEETTKQKKDDLSLESIDAYARHILHIPSSLNNIIKLGTYDADREVYTLISKVFGDIEIFVPKNQVDDFKRENIRYQDDFNEDSFSNFAFFIHNDKLALAKITIGRKYNERKYKYENPLGKNRIKTRREIAEETLALARNSFINKEYQQTINYYENNIEVNTPPIAINFYENLNLENRDWRDLGLAYYKIGNYEKVIECFNNFEKSNAHAIYNAEFDTQILISSYINLKQYYKAYQKCQYEYCNHEALRTISKYCLENKDYKCTISAISKIDRYANDKDYFNLGNAYLGLGDIKNAKETFKISADLGNKDAKLTLQEIKKKK